MQQVQAGQQVQNPLTGQNLWRLQGNNLPGHQITMPQHAAEQQRAAALLQQRQAAAAYAGDAPAMARARAAQEGVEVQPISRFASRNDEQSFAPDGQFNPQAYGGTAWKDGFEQHLSDPKSRIFNASGEINADSKKDAAAEAADHASELLDAP